MSGHRSKQIRELIPNPAQPELLMMGKIGYHRLSVCATSFIKFEDQFSSYRKET